MISPEAIATALKDIEGHANEMARLLIQAGYPLATRCYARAIGTRLMELSTLTKAPTVPQPAPVLEVEEP